jgi:DNA adenine methylase
MAPLDPPLHIHLAMNEGSPTPGSTGTDDAPTNLQHVLIKWTGSKRRQAKQIVARFPRRISTYYEPFLGGGSVLCDLLGSDIEVGRYEVSDLCEPLIALWQVVKDDPRGLVEEYGRNWRLLQVSGAAYYKEARQSFNESHDPHLFFFLLRTCRNGLVRFNEDGDFNSAFRGNRPGMDPETVRTLVEDWASRLSSKNVRFSVRGYRQITAQEGDLIYLDPPYKNDDGGFYSGMFDLGEFFGWLRGSRATTCSRSTVTWATKTAQSPCRPTFTTSTY